MGKIYRSVDVGHCLTEHTFYYEHGKKVFIPDFVAEKSASPKAPYIRPLPYVPHRALKGTPGVTRRKLSDYDL